MAELQTKVFKIRIRGSVDDVWREITKTNEVQGVMFNMKLDSTLKFGERARTCRYGSDWSGARGRFPSACP